MRFALCAPRRWHLLFTNNGSCQLSSEGDLRGEHRTYGMRMCMHACCSFFVRATVCSPDDALAAHVVERRQTPRSGWLAPAHTNSASPTRRRFSAAVRRYAIRARPLAPTPFSDKASANARVGLSSSPLAQSPFQARGAQVPDRGCVPAGSSQTAHGPPRGLTCEMSSSCERARAKPLSDACAFAETR